MLVYPGKTLWAAKKTNLVFVKAGVNLDLFATSGRLALLSNLCSVIRFSSRFAQSTLLSLAVRAQLVRCHYPRYVQLDSCFLTPEYREALLAFIAAFGTVPSPGGH